jgi:hypothetical protein
VTEAKLLGFIVGAVLLLAAVFFGFRAVYDAGDKSGAARIQLQWDQDKADIQRLSDAAIANVTKERDAALQANEVAQNGYQAELSAANASAADFARRLRSAEARLAASSGSVPQASGGQQSADPSSQAGDVRLTNALGAALAECSENAAQLDALIVELKPQLH